MLEPVLSAPTPRPTWLSGLTSLLIHGAIVGVVVWAEAHPELNLRARPDSLALAEQQARAVRMVYLPPPAPSRVDGRAPLPRREPEPPVEEPVVEEPEAETAPPVEPPPPTEEPLAAPPAPRRPARIAFDPRRVRSTIARTEPSPTRPSDPTLEGLTRRCVPGPARSASDPVQWGEMRGVVHQTGTSLPLAGAELQVLGTPYRATSDEHGRYTLRVDLWPLLNCEQQLVRVTLDGFVAQTLTLGIGNTSQSNVALRQY
jgi:hypothetical protein